MAHLGISVRHGTTEKFLAHRAGIVSQEKFKIVFSSHVTKFLLFDWTNFFLNRFMSYRYKCAMRKDKTRIMVVSQVDY